MTDTSQPEPSGHVPVLTEPVLHWLDPRGGQVMLDCTVGRGGHAVAVIPKLVPDGRYIGLDVDPANVEYTAQRLRDAPIQVDTRVANFSDAGPVLDELGVGQADLLLADLGFASTQMDDPQRGLSFAEDGPLDMRLDPSLTTTAADLVNSLKADDLANLIYRYGEERLSRRIAQKIVESRQGSPIKTTAALARLVRSAYGARGRRSGRRHWIDPATRTFMALRVAVNDELGALETLLAEWTRWLRPGGTAAVISFHSLEDRLVKRAFAGLEKDGRGRRLTRKPVTAGEDERQRNPRSRSAKLRAFRLNE